MLEPMKLTLTVSLWQFPKANQHGENEDSLPSGEKRKRRVSLRGIGSVLGP